jgi:hypothetical protein
MAGIPTFPKSRQESGTHGKTSEEAGPPATHGRTTEKAGPPANSTRRSKSDELGTVSHGPSRQDKIS